VGRQSSIATFPGQTTNAGPVPAGPGKAFPSGTRPRQGFVEASETASEPEFENESETMLEANAGPGSPGSKLAPMVNAASHPFQNTLFMAPSSGQVHAMAPEQGFASCVYEGRGKLRAIAGICANFRDLRASKPFARAGLSKPATCQRYKLINIYSNF